MLHKERLVSHDWLTFDKYLSDLPYDVLPSSLYTSEDLFDVFKPEVPDSIRQCYDTRVYMYAKLKGLISTDHFEVMARSMHDCEMRIHLQDFLSSYEQKRVVGIMGGHAMLRSDSSYRETAEISKRLTEQCFLMISGGGPGAMEATHLGAWMAGHTENELDEAVKILSDAPAFSDEGWLSCAFRVKACFPRVGEYESLAIPTWFYGHEPPCAFATKIAKFFDNSIREDTLLTEAYGGLIYMPGSAGTLQEIFQEAVQDHYVSLGFPSPMVFVGTEYWNNEVPVIPFISRMVDAGHYKNLIIDVADTPAEIVNAINKFYNGQK